MQIGNAIYGYARLSTDTQDLTNQVAQLEAAECATIFSEKISGATAKRPQLKKLMGDIDDATVTDIRRAPLPADLAG